MPSRYKYEDGYKKYQSFSLHDEFLTLQEFLLDGDTPSDEMYALVDEIYHWFNVKQNEVEELLGASGIKRCDFCGAIESSDRRIQTTKALNMSIGTFRCNGGDKTVNICEACAYKRLSEAMKGLIDSISVEKGGFNG